MNFFGHATVAGWHADATAPFVLGAMLPDFASISGARSVRATHAQASRGVALHHATDEVFHACEDFVALTTLARERLAHAGLAHGSARAAAHVGVELLLDGLLVDDVRTGSLYVDALRDADAHVACGLDADATRLARFLERARHYGVPRPYRDPQFVAARVEGALASRPRLALAPGGLDALGRVLASLVPEVTSRAGGVLASVRAGLASLAP